MPHTRQHGWWLLPAQSGRCQAQAPNKHHPTNCTQHLPPPTPPPLCHQDGKDVTRPESWLAAHRQALLVVAALLALAGLLTAETFPEPERRNCLALLVFASLLWCTEAVPLFVTSMVCVCVCVCVLVCVKGVARVGWSGLPALGATT